MCTIGTSHRAGQKGRDLGTYCWTVQFMPGHGRRTLIHGTIIAQPGIHYGLPHLFRPDGVHLSAEGCDLYLENVHKGHDV